MNLSKYLVFGNERVNTLTAGRILPGQILSNIYIYIFLNICREKHKKFNIKFSSLAIFKISRSHLHVKNIIPNFTRAWLFSWTTNCKKKYCYQICTILITSVFASVWNKIDSCSVELNSTWINGGLGEECHLIQLVSNCFSNRAVQARMNQCNIIYTVVSLQRGYESCVIRLE